MQISILKRTIILLCGLGFLLSGCIKEKNPDIFPSVSSKRTVLFYLAGDNNLSANIAAEVDAICKGWKYTGNKCLIYIDTKEDEPRLLRVRGGCKKNPAPYIEQVAAYPEENSASAEVFARVVQDVVRDYPADSYGLVFASHASGWLPSNTLSRASRSIGVDSRSGDEEMELSAFAAAIPDGRFDFIVFEACLMGGVEVAFELRNKTKYILASSAELLSPGFVPIYPSSLLRLFDSSVSVEEGLKSFAQSYYNYRYAQTGDYQSMTISVIRTEFLDSLAAGTAAVYKGITDGFDVAKLQHFDRVGCSNSRLQTPCYFDFMDYISCIAGSEPSSEVKGLMDKVVVYQKCSPNFMIGYNGFAIHKHCGMTIYVEQKCYGELNVAYHQTSWWKATHL